MLLVTAGVNPDFFQPKHSSAKDTSFHVRVSPAIHGVRAHHAARLINPKYMHTIHTEVDARTCSMMHELAVRNMFTQTDG